MWIVATLASGNLGIQGGKGGFGHQIGAVTQKLKDSGAKFGVSDARPTIDRRMQHGDRVVQLSEVAATQRAALQTLVGQRQALAERVKQEEC